MNHFHTFESFLLENLNERRDKDLYAIMRPVFDSTPEYVFKELYYAHGGFFKTEFQNLLDSGMDEDDIEIEFEEWIDLNWKKKIITVNISDFTEETQNAMIVRQMGNAELSHVPGDVERTETQRKLIGKYGEGKNEPVILLKKKDGYELMEGWHRTMSVMCIGSDGTDNYKKWDKVKLNAWIGDGPGVNDI